MNDGRLLAHETWHTRQYAMFGGGLGVLTLYLIENVRTGFDLNRTVFEVQAGLKDGGDVP